MVRFQSWAYMSLKLGLTAAGPKLTPPNGGRRILQRNAVGGRSSGDRQGERRVGTEPGDNVRGGILRHDGVGGAHRGLTVFEGVPGEADTRLEVLVVRTIGLRRGNQGSCCAIKIRKVIDGFGWR